MLQAQDLSAYKTAGTTYIEDPATDDVLFYLPFSNTAKITLKGDKESALAQGEDCVIFPKASTLDLEFGVQLLNLNLLSFITGSVVGEKTKQFIKREVFHITNSNEEVEISGTPYGDKIQVVLVADDYENSTHLGELETATYDKNSKKATLTGAKPKDIVAVYYYEESKCRGVTIKATPEKQRNYRVDSIFSNKSSDDAGTESLINVIVPKCTFTSDFDITFDATKASDFTVKLTASKSSTGSLLEIYEIPLEGVEEVTEAPHISDLDVTNIGTSAVLTWTIPENITAIKLMYKEDTNDYAEVNTDGLTGVNIPEVIAIDKKKVTVSGLESGKSYQFKLVMTYSEGDVDSNETASFTVA